MKWALLLWLGPLAAVAAFAHSAAQVGLKIGAFGDWGPSFYAWRADQAQLDGSLQVQGATKPSAEKWLRNGHLLLSSQPMEAAGYRSLAYAYADRGEIARAHQAMTAAQNMTRRDALTQIWLIDYAARRSDKVELMRQFDYLLRTQAEAREFALGRIALLLSDPDVRRALLPLLHQNNPWYGQLIVKGGLDPKSGSSVAQLLIERGWVPSDEYLKVYYQALINILISDNRIEDAVSLYRILPGVNLSALTSLHLDAARLSASYSPFNWNLIYSRDYSAVAATGESGDNTMISASSEPFTRGVVAEKLVLLAPKRQRLTWQVFDVNAGSGAEAFVQMDCYDDGQVRSMATSANLFSLDNEGRGQLAPLVNCNLAILRIVISGGSGREASGLKIGSFALADL